MKDTNSHSKLVKSKRKDDLSDISDSSDSESESVPVIKYVKGSVSDDSDSNDSSVKEARRMRKRKHHHHHHHHHHKRKHKLKEGERLRYDDGRERCEEHPSLRHASHRRHNENRIRVKNEENPQYSGSTSRHRQHRDDSADRIRHHRKREGESRHRRDETSRVKKSSNEHEERDLVNSRRERRGDIRGFRERGSRNGEQNAIPADRPIKEERVSPEEDNYEWGKKSDATAENAKGPPADKAKPNFGLSGKLAEEINTFNGVILKYSEPQEARKPKRRWRFYPFKGDAGLPTLYLHRQSCYLIGRDRKVADIPVDHPSCSKQHAALQYRLVPYQRDDGSTGRRVRPYIIDLESANGTYVNNNKIEPKKYIELLEKDVIKFGYSSREYVLLHEQSKDEALDDDIAANVE